MNRVRRFIVLASAAVILSACNPPKAPVSQAGTPNQIEATIKAGPNPVPAGSSNGTTKIKWTTGDGTTGNVFVSENGAEEHPFASGPQGLSEAPWIQNGKTYEFRLYNSDHTKLLAKVTVTREPQ